MHSRWNTAWCVFGDFNIIRYPSERLGCETFSPAMFAFLDFIGRTLASVDWVEHFVNVSQRVLPRVVSDHCPLLVVAGC